MSHSLRDTLGEITHEIGDIGRDALVAVAVVATMVVLARVVRRTMRRRSHFRELPVVAQTLILNSISVFFAIVACTTVLVVWGATWSAIAAGIGLSTLAIALGLQDILKSLAGGIVIILERPFDIGDRIRIKDLTGEVVDLHVRHIELRMDDGHIATAPNGLLFSEPFENFSRTEGYEYSVVITNTGPRSALTKELIAQAVAAVPNMHPNPDVVLLWDLGRVLPWSRPRPQAVDGAPPRGRRQRAVISWRSKTKETAISDLVRELHQRFPQAEVTVRRR